MELTMVRALFSRMAVAGVLALGLSVSAAQPARADAFGDAVQGLGADDPEVMRQAIFALASGADKRALTTLMALREGKLARTEAGDVVQREPPPARSLRDGSAVPANAALTPILVSNQVRRALSNFVLSP